MDENDVQKALNIVTRLHEGQVDKAGEAYISHPVRVAERMEDCFGKVAALLHDCVEDTGYRLEDVERDFGQEMRTTIDCLTHREGEDYFDYIKRASQNETARKVKIIDLIDNSNLSRLQKVTRKEAKRQQKYNKALLMLLDQ